MFTNFDALKQEIRNNPKDLDEFFLEYMEHRIANPLINIDGAVLKNFFIETWAKEGFDVRKLQMQKNTFNTMFKKNETKSL